MPPSLFFSIHLCLHAEPGVLRRVGRCARTPHGLVLGLQGGSNPEPSGPRVRRSGHRACRVTSAPGCRSRPGRWRTTSAGSEDACRQRLLSCSKWTHAFSVGFLLTSERHLTLYSIPIIKTEPSDDYEPALTCGPMSQGLSPLPKPCYGQPLALPPDPGACLMPGFPPRPQGSASPELHDLSCAPYGSATAGPGHSPLGLPRQVGGVLASQEALRPSGVPPGPPQPPPPTLLQPQVSPTSSGSCSPGCRPALCPHSPSSPLPPGTREPTRLQSCGPAHPCGTGHQQHQPPEVPSSEPTTARPPPPPEVREDSNRSLAPIPVTVKREPQELDPLDLDDGNRWVCCPRRGYRAPSTHPHPWCPFPPEVWVQPDPGHMGLPGRDTWS
ncbi:hypothetical protein FD754_024493 [Muntiacus muntjak]|uniref:Uncharacterized protein n=1 Tax=Muntiacus muntjak TaxID=9888 RepID=A0A5N3UPC4_MUNMU|nr:hypothetical protein FD754_024493 [Muntiacus muntjak]